jgi:hypothetical protein
VGRAPANFRQVDVTKAINAAKRAGLDVVRVDVDPKTAKISVIVKEGEEIKAIPFDKPLVPQPLRPRKPVGGVICKSSSK